VLHVATIMPLHLYITSPLKFLQRARFGGVLYSSLVFRDRRVAIRTSGLGWSGFSWRGAVSTMDIVCPRLKLQALRCKAVFAHFGEVLTRQAYESVLIA